MSSNGSLLQIAATGREDYQLNRDPQITFFREIYRRYTKFASETKILNFDRKPCFGNKCKCIIPKFADLLKTISLQITLENENCPYMGEKFIEYVEISIGGVVVYKNEGEFIYIYNMLHNTYEKKKMIRNLMGPKGSKIRIIPLDSIFKHMSNSISLVGLTFHEVILSIKFNDCRYTEIEDAVLLCEGIYLDSDERNRFKNSTINELIEQVQTHREIININEYENIKFINYLKKNNDLQFSKIKFILGKVFNNIDIRNIILSYIRSKYDNITFNIPLNFSNCCKELYWVIKPVDNNFNFSNHIEYVTLQLNGHDRFEKQNKEYFTKLQQYQYYTSSAPNVYVYPFCLKPETHQPSGSINFSRIDSTNLKIELDKNKINNSRYQVIVYAITYNILTIKDGRGLLDYSIG